MDNLGLLKVLCILPQHSKNHKSSQVLINKALRQCHKVTYIHNIILPQLGYDLILLGSALFILSHSYFSILDWYFISLSILNILYLCPISYSLWRFHLFLLLFNILPTKQTNTHKKKSTSNS